MVTRLQVTLLGHTRWDPRSRAGAVAIKRSRPHDLDALEAVSESVSDWAYYSNVEGEADSVETSPIRGTYDWRAYLEEETRLAKARERAAAAKREKKQERAAPATPPPPVFYA